MRGPSDDEKAEDQPTVGPQSGSHGSAAASSTDAPTPVVGALPALPPPAPRPGVFLNNGGGEYLRLKPIRLQSRLAEEMPPPWANKRRRKDHATGTKDSKVSKARPGVGLFVESTEPGSTGTLPGDVGAIPTQPQYEAFRMKPPDVLRLLRRINPAYNLTRQLQREPGSPEPM